MFEITQKQDKIVLDAISIILPIKVYNKKPYWTCITTNKNDIKYIIKFFNGDTLSLKNDFRIYLFNYIVKIINVCL